jgi:hypothetical protein
MNSFIGRWKWTIDVPHRHKTEYFFTVYRYDRKKNRKSGIFFAMGIVDPKFWLLPWLAGADIRLGKNFLIRPFHPAPAGPRFHACFFLKKQKIHTGYKFFPRISPTVRTFLYFFRWIFPLGKISTGRERYDFFQFSTFQFSISKVSKFLKIELNFSRPVDVLERFWSIER